MKMLQLKRNGWFPFLPIFVPIKLFYGVVLALWDDRSIDETWLRYTLQSVGFGVSFWALLSSMGRRQARQTTTGGNAR